MGNLIVRRLVVSPRGSRANFRGNIATAVPSTATSPLPEYFRLERRRASAERRDAHLARTDSPTRTGARNLIVCDAYTAPGTRVPMMPPNIEARSMPWTTGPGRPAARAAAASTWIGFASALAEANAATSASANAREEEKTSPTTRREL